jgi:hypothetical protein
MTDLSKGLSFECYDGPAPVECFETDNSKMAALVNLEAVVPSTF